MKTLSIIALTTIATLSVVISTAHAASPLADWTFETSMPNGSDQTDNGPYLPEGGLLFATGAASGHHASAATDWSSPAGDGSSHSFSANNWAPNDYWQFSLSTIGFENIMVSYGQGGSATGPADFQFQYSTDGSTFSDLGSTYSLTSSTAFQTLTFDLSSVTSVNTAPTVYFRVVNTSTNAIGGGTVGTAGSDKIDDFVVSGDAIIPEPSVYMLLGLGLLFCGQRFLRTRKSA